MDLLASLLSDHFLKSGDSYALDESITWRLKVASSTNARGSIQLSQVTLDLSMSLLDRYRLNFVAADLEEAIRWARRSVSALPETHERYSRAAYHLAVCLQKKWDRTENLEALEEEIKSYNESLRSPDIHDEILAHRHNLVGVALCQKADSASLEAAQDIEAAARHLFTARDKSRPDSDEYVRALNNLSNLYESAAKIQCSLTLRAVQGAVEAAELAVTLRPNAELPVYSLCKALILKYQKTSCRLALDRSVELGRALCQKSPLSRNQALLLVALVYQFHATANVDLLDEAVDFGLKSIRQNSLNSVIKSKRLVGLGNALVLIAAWKGGFEKARKDISDGITYLQQAAALMRTSQGFIPRGYLSHLAFALVTRYDMPKGDEDLNSAIRTYEDALAVPQPHESHLMSSLHSNLASALLKRFQTTGASNDIRKAVQHGQTAISLASDQDPRLYVRYNNLAASLQSKVYSGFGEGNGSEEIARAVDLYTTASKLAGKNSAAYPGYLNNSGLACIEKVKNNGGPDDFELPNAIEELSEALPLAQGEGPLRAGILLNLAQVWRTKFEQDSDLTSLTTAIAYSQKILETEGATLATKIVGAYHAGIWTLQRGQDKESYRRAAMLLRKATNLLSLLSPTDMALRDRVRDLTEFNAMDITADAVAAALEVDAEDEASCREALQLFEAGRGVIVGNLLERRTELVKLATLHPLLAKQYDELRDAYGKAEQLTTLQAMRVTQDTTPAPATDELNPHHLRPTRIEEAIRRLVEDIRTDVLFRDFPKQKMTLDSLQGLSQDGYIVALNASQIRCDASIVHEGQVRVIPLTNMRYSDLRRRDQRLRGLLTRNSAEIDHRRKEIVEMLRWLWTCCGKIIVDAIVPNRCAASPKPRVWWMAGGVLGRLPLHACGMYSKRSSTAYDCLEGMQHFVMSSYIPTLKSMELAMERAARLDVSQPSSTIITKALVVGVSKTGLEGETELPSTEKELEEVRELLGGESTSNALLNPHSPEVLEELSRCRMAHFACHGINIDDDPSRSYLRLPDFQTNPLTVHALMRLNMSCGFAYLSACDTATSKHPALVDEGLHLANGFLLAGCAGVVGTLWKIPDEDAPQVAAQFYTRLPWRDGHRDTNLAALALHNVISAMWVVEAETKDRFS